MRSISADRNSGRIVKGEQRHHMLWTRNEYRTNQEKRTRQDRAFVIISSTPNHRLLHLMLEPPIKPEPDVLSEMRSLARFGLDEVMDWLEHPIVEHFEQQLSILTLDENVARNQLREGVRGGM